MMNRYRYGVVHGRFQPFHNDHLKYVLTALERSETLFIGITNPDPSSIRFDASDPNRSTDISNPFTFCERMEMIRESLVDAVGDDVSRVRIVPFPINVPWLLKYYTPADAVYFLTIYDEWGEKKQAELAKHGFRTEVLWYKSKEEKNITATKIRDGILKGKQWWHLAPSGTKRVIDSIMSADKHRLQVVFAEEGKTYIVIVDGGADRPIAQFGGKTPFEQAYTPNLDRLALYGCQGMITILNDSIPPESDNGTMAILSYDPLKYYTGRGPLEGLGANFVLLERDNSNTICFRVNLASYDPANKKLDRRTSRDLSNPELQSLAEELRSHVSLEEYDVTFKIVVFGHHRGIVSLTCKNRKLSGNISNTDPGFKKQGAFGIPNETVIPEPLKCVPLDDSEEAAFSAKIVNEFVSKVAKVLSESATNKARLARGQQTANMLLMRDAGEMPIKLCTFKEKFGRTLSMYGQIPAERGLALLLGGKFNYIEMPEHNDEIRLLKESAELIANDDADVICIHILKSADEAGHGGNPVAKAESIERFDKHFIGTLMSRMGIKDSLIVTCDHCTPCELGIHSSDKVPVLVYGNNIAPDNSCVFGESYAKNEGSLEVKYAIDLLGYLFECEN